MARLVLLIHVVLMTALMGAFVIVILSVPALADQARHYIPVAAAIGFLAAIPASILVSRRILEQTRGA